MTSEKQTTEGIEPAKTPAQTAKEHSEAIARAARERSEAIARASRERSERITRAARKRSEDVSQATAERSEDVAERVTKVEQELTRNEQKAARKTQKKAAKQKRKERKTSAIRWKGVLVDADSRLRKMVAVSIAIACVAFTVTSLGFLGIGSRGEYIAYLVLLLQPVALCSLLLGTRTGTLMGLFAGAVLYVHSVTMPLDYFETAYVSVVSSIIELTAIAFVLGFFFALALRNGGSTTKRIILITIICVVCSWLYSAGLFLSGLATSVFNMLQSVYSEAGLTQENASQLALSGTIEAVGGYGRLGIQAWLDALVMALCCNAADILARKAIATRGDWSARTLFNVSLAFVVLLAFMVVAAVNFVVITKDNVQSAGDSAVSEVNYVCRQLEAQSEEIEQVGAMLEDNGVFLTSDDPDFDPEEWNVNDIGRFIAFEIMLNILEGYDMDVDGTIIIYTASGGYVLASDNSRFATGDLIEEHLGRGAFAAIQNSLANETFEKFIYAESDPFTVQMDEDGQVDFSIENLKEKSDTDLAYLYASQVGDDIVVIIVPGKMVFQERSGEMLRTTIIVLVLLLAVFMLTRWLLGHVVTRRIDATNSVLARITAGDLDARVEPGETREFASLSDGINETVVALKGWIAEAEARMDAELATAKAIQESALPQIFPPFPDILRFDIYASMRPAREVGGDFYDFFLIGEDSGTQSGKLGFVIADVSGKGVPAALFMMQAKELIRGYMERGVEIGEAIENANIQLCDGNDTGMFVTVFAGILDYATDRIEYVNAGHNPPLIWQEGEWRWMRERSGLPLGLYDGLPYKTHTIDCQIGDELLMYTDGVTEAMDVHEEQYGEERLENLACENYLCHPRELIEAVRRDVAAFTKGAEQYDDITILALEVGVPPEITAMLTVPAKIDELTRVNEFIHNELNRRMCPQRTQNQIDIAVEELFVNVANYAYPDATPDNPGYARVSYTYTASPPSITVDIADDGIPYNPLAKPDAVTPTDIEDVPIGGLGILMAKKCVDEMSYERVDDSNITTIVKKW